LNGSFRQRRFLFQAPLRTASSYSKSLFPSFPFYFRFPWNHGTFLPKVRFSTDIPEGIRAELEKYFHEAYQAEQNQDFEKAIPIYTKIIHLDNTIPAIFVLRGSCYQQIGEFQNAIADYQKVESLSLRRGSSSLKRNYF
jgi:tetratricopeptide (TPR) repeat protein